MGITGQHSRFCSNRWHSRSVHQIRNSFRCARNCLVRLADAFAEREIERHPTHLERVSRESPRYGQGISGVALTTKSGTEAQQRRLGGNCFVISIAANQWSNAMKGVRCAAEFLKK